MKKKDLYFLFIILTILICISVLWKIGTDNKEAFKKDDISITIVNKFLRALIEENIDKALELSAGSIKSNILSNKDNKKDRYEVVSINSEIESRSDNLSIINSIIESKNQETSKIDVNFFKIYIMKENNRFKIYRIEEVEPYLSEEKRRDNNEIDSIRDVFLSYVKFLSKNEFNNAADMLIGKAKKAHNQTKNIIRNTELIKEPKDFKVEVLYYDEKNAVINGSYINNNKKITVIISFYKTSKGWKIYNVSRI